MEDDELDEEQVYESIMNASAIAKRLRTTDPATGQREYLYVIIGRTFDGVVIYTKGKIARQGNDEVFYVLISSTKSTA